MSAQSKRQLGATLAWVCTLLFALSSGLHAQSLASALGGAKPATTEAAPADPLKRTTPRSAILRFLEACHAGNYPLASQYLDLRRIRADERAEQGADLAQQLADILDHDPRFEVGHLSNAETGDLTDGLAPDIDTLISSDVNGQRVVLQLQRETQPVGAVWLVSADSVPRIPQLHALAGESPLEKKLPAPLVGNKLMGTPLWVWMALVLIALVLSLLSRLLSRLVIAIIGPIVRRYANSLHTYRLETFAEPLRLLVSVVVFRACMEAIAPSALVRDYILKLLALLFIMGAASFLMRVVDVISDQAVSRLDSRQRALSYSVFPLFVRVVKIFIFLVACLFVLSEWGYSTSTILAGVGVGGIAVALAAQKTIENLFGSLSIIADRPVLVGDFCQFGGQVGTIEDIGLRSTRIRTLDRTVVTIPNSVFSTMTLENYSRRDRMWFHPTFHLKRDTRPEQIRQMMDAITKVLQDHEKVSASGVPLRFTKITNESYDLDVFAYVLSDDYDEYLKAQSELLLQIMEAAKKLGVQFAVPFQESVALWQADAPHDVHDSQ